jgi:hypothetical protein
VAELADALDSGSSDGNIVEVRVLSRAPYSCGSGSVVEHRLAKARVAGSNPVFRSCITIYICRRGGMADATDSKSVSREGVGVQVPSPAYQRDVAQLGRALGLGPRGRMFKSCRPD